jgi:hypothetical protein
MPVVSRRNVFVLRTHKYQQKTCCLRKEDYKMDAPEIIRKSQAGQGEVA